MASDSSTSWTCPNCGELIELQFDYCWKCSSDKSGKKAPPPTEPEPKSGSRIGWSVFAFVVGLPLGLMNLVFSKKMNTKVMVGIALICIGVIGLFPPRSQGDHHASVSRGFLFGRTPMTSGLGVCYKEPNDDQKSRGFTKMIERCHIDVGRLICEVLLVAGMTGVVLIVFSIEERRVAKKTHGD